jgi:hypothetical protein
LVVVVVIAAELTRSVVPVVRVKSYLNAVVAVRLANVVVVAGVVVLLHN